jgi:hypothetical protein
MKIARTIHNDQKPRRFARKFRKRRALMGESLRMPEVGSSGTTGRSSAVDGTAGAWVFAGAFSFIKARPFELR